MKKSKIKRGKLPIRENLLDAIVNSHLLEDFEKISYMRYVGYMTQTEQEEFEALV